MHPKEGAWRSRGRCGGAIGEQGYAPRKITSSALGSIGRRHTSHENHKPAQILLDFPASHLSQNRKRVTRTNSRRSGSEMVSIPQSHNSRYQWVAAISRPSWVSLSAAMSFPNKDASTLHHEHALRRTSPGSAPPLLRCPEARTPDSRRGSGAAIRIFLLILFTASFEPPFETKRRALESSRAGDTGAQATPPFAPVTFRHGTLGPLPRFEVGLFLFSLFLGGLLVSHPEKDTRGNMPRSGRGARGMVTAPFPI